jgi:phosphate transport system substrate-binding protein
LLLKRLMAAGAIAIGFAAVSATSALATTSSLTLNGSSLVYPLALDRADAWDYLTGNGFASIQGQGSSHGISGICAGSGSSISPTLDIGTSDAPLGSDLAGVTPTGLNTNCPQYVYQIPWAATATGIAYNVPGVGNGLRLNGKVLSEIFTGKITNWDNPAIQALQKETYYTHKTVKYKKHGKTHKKRVKVKHTKVLFHLKNLAITVIYRNGSGDTFALENYLVHAPGAVIPSGDTVSTNFWTPAPSGAVLDGGGNTGMISTVDSTKGGIGYIAVSAWWETYYQDLAQSLPTPSNVKFGALVNKAGNYELPNYANVAKAVGWKTSLPSQSSLTQAENFALSVVDPPASLKSAYPLSTYTYAIVDRSALSDGNSAAVKSYLQYSVSSKWNGTTGGAALDEKYTYIGLPSSIQKADMNLINSLP